MGWVAFSNVKTTACLVHMCPRLSPNAEYAILDSRLHQCRLASHTRRRRDRREVVYNYLLQCISASVRVERRVGGSSMEGSLVNLGSTYSFQINWISGRDARARLTFVWLEQHQAVFFVLFWMEDECDASHPYLTAEPRSLGAIQPADVHAFLRCGRNEFRKKLQPETLPNAAFATFVIVLFLTVAAGVFGFVFMLQEACSRLQPPGRCIQAGWSSVNKSGQIIGVVSKRLK